MELFILTTPTLTPAQRASLGQALIDHVEAFLGDEEWLKELERGDAP